MEEFGVKVSTSTIWRAVNATAVATTTWYEQLIGRIPPPRYLCIDEKYIPVHGKKRPNQLFVDPETTIGYKQKLLRNRTEAGIYRELKLLKKRGNLEVIITDDWKSYAPAIKRLGLRHQKCIFHAKRAFRRAMKRARIQKKRKQKFVRWADCFLDSKNINEAKKWLRVLGRTKKEKKLQRFMKSFLFDWKDYFTYLEFDDCPKTTNAAEQHNRLFEQKRQTMHGFRNERSAKLFTKLFSVYSLFRKFEEGKYKGLCPLEIAKVQLPQMDMFALLQ
jgi:transposase-like protein